MLTPNDDSGQGRLTLADSRGRRQVLYEFLKGCLELGQRDIRKLREVMPKLGVDFMPFRDAEWFTHQQRTEYFDAVPDEYLTRSVIFCDPDIGLETRTPGYMQKSGPEKYLQYSELLKVWMRASADSVVVVYQHLQKDAHKRAGDVERRIGDLGRWLATRAWAVQWNDLAFLVTAHDGDIGHRIRAMLIRHAQRHSLAFREGAA